ncbi:zinc finger protein 346 isoform 3-T3 [Sylvia borin]
MSAAASIGGCGALAGHHPAVARRGWGARAAYRENGVRRRRWPWRTGPVATGTLRGRCGAADPGERTYFHRGAVQGVQRPAHLRVTATGSLPEQETRQQGETIPIHPRRGGGCPGEEDETGGEAGVWIHPTETVPPQKHPAALPTSTASSNEENKDITDPDKFCSLCHATFNNPLMAKQHYVGKKHRKQETKHKLMAHYGRTPDAPASSFMAGKGYPCSTCNIVLNSIEQYQAHISGFKHKNQMPGAVPVVGPFPPQQYVREESTAPGGYSYFSQDF